MKKCIVLVLSLLCSGILFAVSYVNNTYQKLADEYERKARSAFNAGLYDDAVEYSKKAAENAALSEAYIQKMMARGDAETQLKLAQEKMKWAQEIRADRNFPMAFSSAAAALANAESAFGNEDYVAAQEYANQVLAALDGVREITPLPQFYVVRPWADTKDCYWNISGRPYIYNNPLLWENLYQKNKDGMPKPEDPNLILPGMKMEIPSLTGEFREGTYNPSKKYDAYSVNR
ncbi:MAG: hypothetical protein K6E51_08500 [Treponema sp.]|nr:hypothetical protein [Treponema sp.]